jgi:hypothetical protein
MFSKAKDKASGKTPSPPLGAEERAGERRQPKNETKY